MRSGQRHVHGRRRKYGYTDPTDKLHKTEHYKLIQSLAKEFEEANGSIVCRELLKLSAKKETPTPEDRTDAYYKKRPCALLVEQAAQILDECINSRNREERKIMRIAVVGEGTQVTEHLVIVIVLSSLMRKTDRLFGRRTFQTGTPAGFLPNFLADRG